MLTAVVVAYIILVGVPSVTFIVLSLIGINIANMVTAGLTFSVLLNYAINFFLYNAFDAKFREKTLSLFGCSSRRRISDVITRVCSTVIGEEMAGHRTNLTETVL